MSAPASNDDKVQTDTKSSSDIFKGLNENLNEGDPFDSLDLTTPIPDKDKKEDKPKEEKEEEESEEEETEENEDLDELSDLEDELADPDEDKLELNPNPIRRREILKEFPELFKKFPQIESSIYREREFTKLFPTIKDAQAAIENSKTLEAYAEDVIVNGNTINVLKMIKQNDENKFAEVVDNYLENLASVDEKAYNHVLSNVIKNAVAGMVQAAKDSGDDDYRIAAGLLYKYVFNSTKYEPPKKLAKEKTSDPKDNSVEERERAFVRTQLDTATNEIDSRVNGTIKSYIEKNIDPNNSMTEYIKSNAVRDAVDKISELIKKDSRFNSLNAKLWDQMVKSNFSKDSKDKIAKAYLNVARSLMAPVIKSARKTALQGMGKRTKSEDVIDINDKEEKPARQKTTERKASSDKNKPNLDAVKGMSSYEALNSLMGD